MRFFIPFLLLFEAAAIGQTYIITTVASTGLNSPAGVAVDPAGNVYVADSGNNVVRMISAQTGVMSTVAGNGTAGFSGDGSDAIGAALSGPMGVAVDTSGNLYIADTGNHRIRKVSGGIINTVAGNGTAGYSGDEGAATSARLNAPYGVAADPIGNIYIADTANHCARRVSRAGVITTLGGYSANAAAFPRAVSLDATGNLYITDTGGGTIQEFDTSGYVFPVAGTTPSLNNPSGVGVDAAGNIYVADTVNGKVRRVVSTIRDTIAGDGPIFSSGDGIPGNSARLLSPFGLALDSSGNVYFSESKGNRIRKLTPQGPAPCLYTVPFSGQSLGTMGGFAAITVTTNPGCAWTATAVDAWITVHNPQGTGAAQVSLTVAPNSGPPRTGTVAITGGNTYSITQPQGSSTCPITIPPPDQTIDASGGPGSFIIVTNPGCAWTASAHADWLHVSNSTGTGTGQVSYTADPNAVVSRIATFSITGGNNVVLTQKGALDAHDYRFVPLTPCRVIDTRSASVSYGGPSLAAGTTRSFPLWLSSCGYFPVAVAMVVNVTAVPRGPLGYLTMWPSAQAQPFVSTLNSPTGAIVANEAVVPVGSGISVFATDTTDVVIDISGYFAADFNASGTTLQFYPLPPCRVADTRNAGGALGGPSLAAGASRSFPVPQSDCGIPATAEAYSMNVTAVPAEGLAYLTAWPTGASQQLASTLNSLEGRVVANAAIVPAGMNGAVSLFATDSTDAIIDISGYFAPLLRAD